jgi:plastocyanin
MAIGALTLAGCSSGSSKSSENAAPPVSIAGQTNNHGTTTASSSTELELDDFYFEATFLKATAGQKFTIELKNKGKATHTFTSPSLGIDEQLAPGTSKTLSVTAPQSGTALFFCRFHQGQGMQGAIYIG